ncbi:hypothetical protein BaRGS_00034333, partial [Batillaria attramentaria]
CPVCANRYIRLRDSGGCWLPTVFPFMRTARFSYLTLEASKTYSVTSQRQYPDYYSTLDLCMCFAEPVFPLYLPYPYPHSAVGYSKKKVRPREVFKRESGRRKDVFAEEVVSTPENFTSGYKGAAN